MQNLLSIFLVASLPYSDGYNGEKAVSIGNQMYLMHDKSLYQLMCDNRTCTWEKMRQELDDSFADGSMMLLPEGYTC